MSEIDQYLRLAKTRSSWSVEELTSFFNKKRQWVRLMIDRGEIPTPDLPQNVDPAQVDIPSENLQKALKQSDAIREEILGEEQNAASTSSTSSGTDGGASLGGDSVPDMVQKRLQSLKQQVEDLQEDKQQLKEEKRELHLKISRLEADRTTEKSGGALEKSKEFREGKEKGRQEVLDKIYTFSSVIGARIENWLEKEDNPMSGLRSMLGSSNQGDG
ncbi:MAG: hypothetical protein ABEJ65_07580 [bacterium]